MRLATGRVRRRPSSPLGPLVSSALGMMGGKATGMVLGFLFWMIAARIAPADAVGVAAGATSTIMLVALLASSGVGAAAILHYHRDANETRAVVDTSLTVVALLAAAIAGAFLLVARGLLDGLQTVATDVRFALLFGTMSIVGTVGVVLDQISMAQRRGRDVMTRNTANGLVTLVVPALIWLGLVDASSRWLFAGWVLGSIAAVVIGWLQLRGVLDGRWPRPRLERRVTRRLLRSSGPNQLLTTAERTPGLLLPVIVTELLTPADNAYWYTSWMIAWGVAMVPLSTATALFAETSRGSADHRPHLRAALRSSLSIGVALAAVVIVTAPLILRLAGRDYADASASTLRILVLGVIPLSFTYPYFALARSTGRIGQAIATATLGGALAVASSTLAGTRWGLTGMAAAWIGSQACIGAWAALQLRTMLVRQAILDEGDGRSPTSLTTLEANLGSSA